MFTIIYIIILCICWFFIGMSIAGLIRNYKAGKILKEMRSEPMTDETVEKHLIQLEILDKFIYFIW